MRIAEERPWLGYYLRLLAVLYAYGASMHLANILGFGEMPWLDSPLAWQAGDVAYLALDVAAATGLWLRRGWGVTCFLLAAGSQLFLYLGFPQLFALTDEHHQALRVMVLFHAVTLLGFGGLWLARK